MKKLSQGPPRASFGWCFDCFVSQLWRSGKPILSPRATLLNATDAPCRPCKLLPHPIDPSSGLRDGASILPCFAIRLIAIYRIKAQQNQQLVIRASCRVLRGAALLISRHDILILPIFPPPNFLPSSITSSTVFTFNFLFGAFD